VIVIELELLLVEAVAEVIVVEDDEIDIVVVKLETVRLIPVPTAVEDPAAALPPVGELVSLFRTYNVSPANHRKSHSH
jgi:hypothetical protein